jgi:carboxyl-terminal processing protease
MPKTPFVIYSMLALVGFACKNNSPLNQAITVSTSYKTDGTPNRKVSKDVRDSVYFWAETAYLWYKNLPNANTLQPNNMPNADAVIAAVRSYSEKNTSGANLDRWSFVMDKKQWDNVASGKSYDHGIYFRFAPSGQLYVRQIFKNSAAGLAGVQRGWQVQKIAGLIPSNDNGFISQFNTALNSPTISIDFALPDGSVKNLSLKASDYQTDPVQAVNIFESDNKKIGYFCFTDFLGDNTSNQLIALFQDFQAKGVTDLVIDLRYNGGGYVALAQQLMNQIAPSAANGKLMFSYEYNDKLNKTYGRATNFSLKNNININKVVVITSKNSASASELLINSLKPHMDVKIVGSNSHGKPVGFPVIPVMNFVVAPVAFKTVNSLGQADYYEGFTPDFPEIDDLTKPFGHPEEKCLKVALEYLKTGKVTTNSSRMARLNAIEYQNDLNKNMPTGFNGMYTFLK